jgi:26S proteasome regulatory subunit N9
LHITLTSMSPVDFLEALQAKQPEIAADVAELASLYQRKLWHQLTVKLEECFKKADFNKGDLPMRLYESFISDFASKINLLKLAQFAVHVSQQQRDPAKSLAFLQSVVAKLQVGPADCPCMAVNARHRACAARPMCCRGLA